MNKPDMELICFVCNNIINTLILKTSFKNSCLCYIHFHDLLGFFSLINLKNRDDVYRKFSDMYYNYLMETLR